MAGGRMSRASSDRLSGEGARFASGGPADARAGPRIFVGKLNKETTEGDVRVRMRMGLGPCCQP